MSILSCPSCGSSAEPNGSAAYTNCSYCQCTISVADFFSSSSSNTLEALKDYGLDDDEQKKFAKLLDKAEFYLDANEYAKASNIFEDCLDVFPKHLPSRFNLALCELYSKDVNVVEKSLRAEKIISASAVSYQLIPELIKIRDSISFNIASMGVMKNNSGDALTLFNISRRISEDNKSRDDLVIEYFDTVYERLKHWFDREIKNKKKSFTINKGQLDLIVYGAAYSKDLANLGATIFLFFKDYPEAISGKIKNIVNESEEAIFNHCSDTVDKVKFGIFKISIDKFTIK